MPKRGFSRRGQGEVLTVLFLAEVLFTLLVFLSWYYIVQDKQVLLEHVDLDQDLTNDVISSLHKDFRVERTDGEQLFILREQHEGALL